jgi:hypothetical protein
VSAVPDLKQELLDILETPLSPVTVHYAEPQRLPDEYEIVFISGTPNYVRGSGGLLGEQFRSESFGLASWSRSSSPATTPRQPTNAAGRSWT